mgnify:CR=1 FL=1
MKLQTLVTLITEGGFALKGAGVGRINKEDIPRTVQLVSKLSGIPLSDLKPLGSVGKTPTSGDIDLAVDANKYDVDPIHQKMVQELGEEKCILNKGTKVASYAFPIAGDESKGLVQVDLMYVASPSWAEFSYHSPGGASKYKGALRNILLMAVASSYHEPGTDHFEFDPDTNEITIRAGRTLDLNQGFRRIFQHRPRNKKTNAYLKTMKTITPEQFQELFPDVDVQHGEITIDDPKKVLLMLFGKPLRANDVSTAEQVIELIKSSFDEQEQDEIFKKAASRARAVVGKMDIPPEIQDRIQ